MADKIWATLSYELAAATSSAGNSVVAVVGRRHPSSGIVFRQDAVVTAHHALRRDDEITVITGPDQRVKAHVAGRDPGTDIAVLRLEKPVEAPVAMWGSTAQLKVGELVLALGRTWRANVVASAGILSGVIGGPWRTWRNGELDQFIRPDLTFYSGFSGGPLLASSGSFLGMNTVGLHRNGITIPASTLQRVASDLLEKGRIERPYLGLGMTPVALPESLRSKLNLTASEGLLVAHVEPDGPAEQAGVMLGDLMLELAGQSVTDTEGVQNILRSAGPGQEIEAAMVRAGTSAHLRIRLGVR